MGWKGRDGQGRLTGTSRDVWGRLGMSGGSMGDFWEDVGRVRWVDGGICVWGGGEADRKFIHQSAICSHFRVFILDQFEFYFLRKLNFFAVIVQYSFPAMHYVPGQKSRISSNGWIAIMMAGFPLESSWGRRHPLRRFRKI